MNVILVEVILTVLAGVVASVGLLASVWTTQNAWARRLSWIGVALLIPVTLWNAQKQVSSLRTTKAIQTLVYKELATSTYRYLSRISELIVEASDGWLPTTESEFFSRRSIDLLCRKLNVLAPANVTPARPWGQQIAEFTGEYKTVLSKVRVNSRLSRNSRENRISVEGQPNISNSLAR
jgi:hypothetical protein